MLTPTFRMTLAVLAYLVLAATAAAQDFSIRTQVYNLDGVVSDRDGGKPQAYARSLTIFHAGNVYDYVDTVDEVIVFEPARNQFTIISKPKMMVTTVQFDELKRLLHVAQEKGETYAQELERKNGRDSPRIVGPLRFQLAPQFEEQYDEKQKRLDLTSRHFRYSVQCAAVESPEIPVAYLHYADWTARLNSILHPKVFPGPRLALNEALRRRGVMPIRVELQADLDARLHLRAEHTIHWKLQSNELSQIHVWNALRQRPDMKEVTFRNFVEANFSRPVTQRR